MSGTPRGSLGRWRLGKRGRRVSGAASAAEALRAADRKAASYARLFLVPGMNHCAGGPTTERFDVLTALEDWVEHRTAPETLVASVNPDDPDVVAARWSPQRTRPLCAYPKQAHLRPGAADIESADSFACR